MAFMCKGSIFAVRHDGVVEVSAYLCKQECLKGRVLGQRTCDNVACVMCERGCIAAEGSHYVRSADPIIG